MENSINFFFFLKPSLTYLLVLFSLKVVLTSEKKFHPKNSDFDEISFARCHRKNVNRNKHKLARYHNLSNVTVMLNPISQGGGYLIPPPPNGNDYYVLT